MNLTFSSVVNAKPAGHGGHFSVRRLDLEGLGQFAAPVMGFDHYRMNGPTFAPHPHAGFSAVSYVFEDSIGGLRNRDSLQHDVVIEPGAMVWTQAGSGVMHDEFPARAGREVHGVQVFINLSRRNKTLPPKILHVAGTDVPVVMDTSGNRTRVLSGRFSGANSPLEPTEPFDFLDVQVRGNWSYRVPSRRNVLVYVLSGAVTVQTSDQVRVLQPFQAISARAGKTEDLHVSAQEPAQILVLSGVDPGEPVAAYGHFIMNDEAQLAEAVARYRRGEMGHLLPLDQVGH